MRVLGIDIGGTNVKSGIVIDGQVTNFCEMPTEAELGGRHVLDKVLNIIEVYSDYECIGISSAGQIDPVSGHVIYATDNIPGWTGQRIKDEVASKFQVPVAVENDVNAAAVGEAYYGAGKGRGSFICLTYGTGIGGAIIENGMIYHGSSNSAGEFGHLVTHGFGKNCTCGNKGCYEVYASTTALIRRAKENLPDAENLNGRVLMSLALENPSIYTEIIHPWLDEIILGLRSIIHIFNPSLIVLGGGIMEQQYMMTYVREHIGSQIMASFRKIDFSSAQLGNHAGLIGAAQLAILKREDLNA